MNATGRRALSAFPAALAAVTLAGCSLAGSQGAPDVSRGDSCTVARVVDGDTIWGDCGRGKAERIRMIGLNTPETKDPSRGVQCYGPEAAKRARQLLDGQNVTLKTDRTQDSVDKESPPRVRGPHAHVLLQLLDLGSHPRVCGDHRGPGW